MDVECPYCSVTFDVTSLDTHVRSMDDESHGSHGSVPVTGVDNPWNLRIDVSDPDAGDHDSERGDVPAVEHVADDVRTGRCPACERGILGLKGGDGFLSSGRRRLACPNCRWESPEWIEVTD